MIHPLMMRHVLAVLLVLPLCGCDETKRQAIAECEMKSRSVYPNQTDESEMGKAGDYVFECMEAKGYVTVGDLKKCPYGRGWVGEIDETCYRKPWPWE